MAQVTLYPSTELAILNGGFINPANAYSDNTVYAENSGSARNSDYTHEFGGFGVDGAIPAGSTINSVNLQFERRFASTVASTHGIQAWVDGVAYGTETVSTAVPTTDTLYATNMLSPVPTRDQLDDASFRARIRFRRTASGGTGNTMFLDHVRIIVDYTPPVLATETATDLAIGIDRRNMMLDSADCSTANWGSAGTGVTTAKDVTDARGVANGAVTMTCTANNTGREQLIPIVSGRKYSMEIEGKAGSTGDLRMAWYSAGNNQGNQQDFGVGATPTVGGTSGAVGIAPYDVSIENFGTGSWRLCRATFTANWTGNLYYGVKVNNAGSLQIGRISIRENAGYQPGVKPHQLVVTGSTAVNDPFIAVPVEGVTSNNGTATVGGAAATASASGTHSIGGTASVTAQKGTASATGTQSTTGTAAATAAKGTATASGTQTTTGTATPTAAKGTASATGTQSTNVTSNVTSLQASVTASGTHSLNETDGTATLTASQPSVSAVGTLGFVGTASATAAPAGVSAAGTQGVGSTSSVVAQAASVSASGSSGSSPTATASLTATAPTVTTAGTQGATGTGAATAPAPTVSGAGTHTAPGVNVTANVFAASPYATSAGTHSVTGTAVANRQSATLSALGNVAVNGSAILGAQPPSFFGQGFYGNTTRRPDSDLSIGIGIGSI